MCNGKRLAGSGVALFGLLAGTALMLSGCALFGLFGGAVAFDTIIEDTISFEDDHSTDSNDYWFYWDWYEVRLDPSRSYTLELWTDPDCPIHFECDQLGQDLGAWDDGDQSWDGYLLYTLPAGLDSVGFDFYLRSDYVGDTSWYQFRINEM